MSEPVLRQSWSADDPRCWWPVAHLRTSRHRDVGDMVEDWVIEPGSGRWERRSVRSRAELDALVEQFRPRILKPTEAEVQRALKRLEEDGKYDPATGEFEWDKPTPCRICGRSDGQHDPTKAERRAIRRLKWRAFWRGFCDPFGVFHVG